MRSEDGKVEEKVEEQEEEKEKEKGGLFTVFSTHRFP